MTDQPPRHPDWAAAASAVDFAFYQLHDPAPDYMWTGGHGSSHGVTTSLEIMHDVAGVEVSVRTESHPRKPLDDPWPIEGLLYDLTWYAILAGEGPPQLPLSLTVSEENRTIDIDGTPQIFQGVGIDLGGWSGSSTLSNGLVVLISVRGVGVAPRSLTQCDDTDLPISPPTRS